MQGIVFLGDRQLELREFADPTPGPGEVVVEMKASGLCGSDLHRFRSAAIPEAERAELCVCGHEPAGIVAAVGAGVTSEKTKVGDRVMVNHYSGCTRCAQCRSGWPQMCTEMEFRLYGTNENGSHAPYMKVPVETLVPLDERLSFIAGAAIGCGTGTAWGGIERAGEIGGQTIAVIGQGPVGLSATMLATARGAQVIAVDISAERLERARHFGAVHTINAAENHAASAIKDLTGGGVPVSLETSGATPGASTALASLAKWGTACFIGLGGRVEFSVLEYLQRQITLRTSWSMSIVDQDRCATFIAERRLPVDDLFSHQWSIGDAEAAYLEFDKQTSGKAAFIF
jgi:threonine dehydrogenase-like Zn-dependent dehydrogenase